MEKLSLLWFALLRLERPAPDVAYIHEQGTKLLEGALGAGGRGHRWKRGVRLPHAERRRGENAGGLVRS
jgi:hypothetical protein